MPQPTVTPTRAWHIVMAAALGVGGAWLGLTWWQGTGGTLPVPGFFAWASVVLICLGVGWLARRTRAVLLTDPTSLDPQQAVTRLLLGKTSQWGGAFLGGAYAGLVLSAVPGLPAPLAVERIVHSGIALVACVMWVVAGRWLENVCRVRDLPGDKDADTPDR